MEAGRIHVHVGQVGRHVSQPIATRIPRQQDETLVPVTPDVSHTSPATAVRSRRMRAHQDASDEVLDRLRACCLALPEATEERAWVGTRWRIRTKTFAHVVPIEDGWPPAYVRAAGSAGPLTVLTFRADAAAHAALRAAGAPFFVPVWWLDIVGMVIDEDTDWAEVGELVAESYELLAPKRLLKNREPIGEQRGR
jgi:predicted DNA-binding protein (MmcQ/YjbR family)